MYLPTCGPAMFSVRTPRLQRFAASMAAVALVAAGLTVAPGTAAYAAEPISALEVRGEVASSNGSVQTSYLGPSRSRLYVDGRDGQSLTLGTIEGAPHLVTINANEPTSAIDNAESWSLTLPRNIGPGTYDTARYLGAAAGAETVFDVSGGGRGCNQLPGRLIVHEAEWNGGAPVRLSLAFVVRCGQSSAPATVGELRWSSARPFGRALADVPTTRSNPATAQVGTARDVTVRLTGATADPVTLGAADLLVGDSPTADSRIAGDGCAGRTLTFGAVCEVVVRFAPQSAGDKPAVLRIPDGTSAPVPVVLHLKATAQPGQPQSPFGTPLLGRVQVSWEAPGSTPKEIAGYAIDLADSAAPEGWRQVAETPKSPSRWTVADLAPGATVTFAVRSRYVDGTSGPRSYPITRRVATAELFHAGSDLGPRVRGLDPASGPVALRPAGEGGSPGDLVEHVVVSPSGRYVAYTAASWNGRETVHHVVLQDLHGGRPFALPEASAVDDSDVDFADEQTLVLVQAPLGTPSATGLVLATRGTGGSNLTFTSSTAVPNSQDLVEPAVLEPGPRPVMVAAAADGSGLWRITSDGVRTQLTGTVGGREPAAGPDGQIAFVVPGGDGADDLRVRTADGQSRSIPLPAVGSGRLARVQDPSFSPSGDAVVASLSEDSYGRDVWQLGLLDGSARKLTTDGHDGEEVSPVLRGVISGPSPSAPPSASPSPSPSPSPSLTPSPTAPTDRVPSLTVAPPVISSGQRVVVTYHGTPGTTLTIYSKTQPATGYSRLRSVQLDMNGTGSSSHVPMRNTRLMARSAGGRDSAQPLVQVGSVASINAARVRPGTYRFTGRVYPARTGRLVSLYRNSRLFAQARTDSSGIYTITKASAGGTLSFYARTAADTYNLGTTSRSLRISVY